LKLAQRAAKARPTTGRPSRRNEIIACAAGAATCGIRTREETIVGRGSKRKKRPSRRRERERLSRKADLEQIEEAMSSEPCGRFSFLPPSPARPAAMIKAAPTWTSSPLWLTAGVLIGILLFLFVLFWAAPLARGGQTWGGVMINDTYEPFAFDTFHLSAGYFDQIKGKPFTVVIEHIENKELFGRQPYYSVKTTRETSRTVIVIKREVAR
jgi:hypothetical protein